MIRTERLVLRPPTMADAPPMHQVLSNEIAMRHWSTLPHATLAQTEAWVASMIEAERAGTSTDDCIVELDGRVIGKAGFWREPELGFILHPDHHRRGLATEALTALLDRAFSVRLMPRVVVDVDPKNHACLALMARLGFQEFDRASRTFCRGGVWSDSVFLELAAARSAPSRRVG